MFKTNIINSLIHTFLEVLLGFYSLFFRKIAKGVEGRKKSFNKIKTSFSKNDKISKEKFEKSGIKDKLKKFKESKTLTDLKKD